jgi:hypothetical protein
MEAGVYSTLMLTSSISLEVIVEKDVLSGSNVLGKLGPKHRLPEEAIVQQLVAQIPWGHNVRFWTISKIP